MFWSRKRHDKIHVEFVETGKNKPFAVSMIPIEQLPATFEVATTLDIADKKWSVVDAEPKNRSDFERSGKLRVVLSPVQMVNPKDILFSLPTINDRMCELHEAKSLDGMVVIHEDDWRQIEFISETLIADVEVELQSIKAIYETKRRGVGFTGMHIRKMIESPINDGAISYTSLKNFFSLSKEFSGFGVGNYMAVAENGFSFETDQGLRFYGVMNRDGNVAFLCLANADEFGGEMLRDDENLPFDRCQLVSVPNYPELIELQVGSKGCSRGSPRCRSKVRDWVGKESWGRVSINRPLLRSYSRARRRSAIGRSVLRHLRRLRIFRAREDASPAFLASTLSSYGEPQREWAACSTSSLR